LDGDGTQLDSKTYKEGEVLPTTDKVPTKAADEQNTYTFAQWDGGTVDGNVTTYKPEFIATAILKVIWLDGDGSQLDSKTYAQGEAVPTTDKVPTKVADAQNTYVFKEWTLTADGAVRTYAPEFTAVPISAPVYTVIWLDGDDSELDRKTYHEGEPVPATDKIPTKAPDAENTYVFNEWKLQSEVGNDRTYKPEFTAVPIGSSDRTVIWLNGDGTTLDSKTYQEGEAEPTTDKIPVKAEDDQNTYVFSKWDSGTVDGAVKTYKPDFTAVPKASSARTVIWLNGDGSQLDSKTYQEGEAEPTTDKTPTKTENGVALTFTGWDGGTVNGNVKTYAPQFAQPGASYTVTVEDGGTGSGTYKPGDTVYITAAPEKDNRIFADWTWSGPEGFVIPDSLSNLTSFTMPEGNVTVTPNYQGGCYVATAVYGSYDCPEVWTLRRFRDTVLAKTWYGRLFIRLYYAVSPTAVKLFGDCGWFQNFWRGRLDSMVSNLQESGFESTPYQDKAW
ncbi:MAG: hypothetical protein IKN96_01275, partial [Oscillibacter sp.]|nr:hypothetical protein [Oscillibacter sp.]